MKVILDQDGMLEVARRLKAECMDYYLFFVLMYRTGVTGAKLLHMDVKDVEGFITTNFDLLQDELIDEIKNHCINRNPNSPFLCNKYSENRLPRRTIEHWVTLIGNEVLNTSDFGFKSIQRTFYFEYLKNNNFNFNIVKKLFSSRRMYQASLESFLEYLGMTEDEYNIEVLKSNKERSVDYIYYSKLIIEKLYDLVTKSDISEAEKLRYTVKTKEILGLLRTVEY